MTSITSACCGFILDPYRSEAGRGDLLTERLEAPRHPLKVAIRVRALRTAASLQWGGKNEWSRNKTGNIQGEHENCPNGKVDGGLYGHKGSDCFTIRAWEVSFSPQSYKRSLLVPVMQMGTLRL